MKNKLNIISGLVIVALTSCGQVDAPQRLNNGSTKITQKSKAPAMLIARIKKDELNKQSGKIEIVSLADATAIKSGTDAARAFASGKPMTIRQTTKGPEAVNDDAAVLLATKQSTELALDTTTPPPSTYPTTTSSTTTTASTTPPPAYPTNTTQPPAYPTTTTYPATYPPPQNGAYPPPQNGAYPPPAGGYYPPTTTYPTSTYSAIAWLASAAQFMGGLGMTMQGIMMIFQPFAMMGGIGMPYGGMGTYPDAGYQYYPYAQQGGMPQGGMPQGGMPQGGMPQGGYPANNGSPQNTGYPQQPNVPTGQEPMPTNLM